MTLHVRLHLSGLIVWALLHSLAAAEGRIVHPVVRPFSQPPASAAEAVQRLTASGGRVIQNDDGTMTVAFFCRQGDEAIDGIVQCVRCLSRVRLQLFYFDEMTTSGVRALASLGNVTALTLGETPITDAGVSHLARMRNLTSLRLLNNRQPAKLTNQSVEAIVAGLPELQELLLNDAHVDDGALPLLASMQHLRSLNLHETHISSDGLDALERCAALEELHIGQTLVRMEAVDKLQRARPGLQVPRQEGIIFWEWDTGRQSTSYGFRGFDLAFSANRKWMAASSSTEVCLFERPAGRYVRTLRRNAPQHEPLVFSSVAVSPDGSRIALGELRSRVIWLWDAQTGRTLRKFRADIGPPERFSRTTSLDFSADGQRLAGCVDGALVVWEVDSREQVICRGPHHNGTGAYLKADISPDGSRVLVCGGTRLEVWDIASRRKLGEHGGILDAGFRPDGTVVAIRQGPLTAYDRVHADRNAPPELVRVVDLSRWNPLRAVLAAEAGIAAFFCDNSVLVIDLVHGRIENEFSLPAGHSPGSLTLSPDGQLVVVTSTPAGSLLSR